MGALLGGLVIGAVVGGVSYALQHRGQPLACFLQDPDFWRAVAIGGVSGTVSGFVAGFFAPLMLLSSSVGTAMQIGGLIGMLSSFSSHVVTNVLYGRPVAEGLGWAMLSGAVFGALGGALGYWAQQARLQPTTQPGTGNGCTGGACSSSGGPVCFVAGTQIATPEGNVAIEDIREGDAVYALDAEGNVVVSTVVDAFTRTATSLVNLTLRDASGTVYTITGTPEHPFYVPVLGDFVSMGDLTPGTELRGLDGVAVTVVAVRARAAAVTVYNFEVAETHTYFVAAESGGAAVGVHNACEGAKPGNVLKEGTVYRNGSAQPRNLTPRPVQDTDGLSTFNALELASKPGEKAQVIDIAKLPKSLQAVFDDVLPGHISIRPPDSSLIPEWAAARDSDYIHPLTQAIMDAIIGVVRRPK